MPTVGLPDRPPFAIRARILSPLRSGETLHEPDGVVAVDAAGSLSFVGSARAAAPDVVAGAVDRVGTGDLRLRNQRSARDSFPPIHFGLIDSD